VLGWISLLHSVWGQVQGFVTACVRSCLCVCRQRQQLRVCKETGGGQARMLMCWFPYTACNTECGDCVE
jgi:hypothetical protein